MGLLLIRVKANTATTGTGAATPGSAVVPYQSWAAAGAVSGIFYSYLIEDGTAWEIGTGLYNGTTITRPGPTADPSFASSSGALINLSGSATIACVANVMDLSGPKLLQSLSVSAVSSVLFDNTKITATYKTYEIRYEGVTPSAADVLMAQVSPDNGVTWRATGYISQRSIWGMTTNFSNYALNGTTTGFPLVPDGNIDAARPMNGHATFYDLMSATRVDVMQGECVGKMSDNNIYDCRMGGVYNTAAEAHNAIRIVAKGGVATFSGTFKLYGVP